MAAVVARSSRVVTAQSLTVAAVATARSAILKSVVGHESPFVM
jgi:hypothetical protein